MTAHNVSSLWKDRALAAEAVVAAQREALRECDVVIAVMTRYMDDLLDRARVANTPSLTHRDSAGPFGQYAQARLEELVGKVSALVVARAALDAEGVSEPGADQGVRQSALRHPAGSLTSPVDTTCATCGHRLGVHKPGYGACEAEDFDDEFQEVLCGCQVYVRKAPLTSPVDSAPLPCTCHTTGSYSCPAHEPDPR